ncbi:hypothetical protein ACOSQ3_031477 [Xanthoceras sorbifolium]
MVGRTNINCTDIDVEAEHICAKTTETCDKEEPSNQGKKYKGKEVCDDSSIILLLSKGKECSEAAEMWQRHIKQVKLLLKANQRKKKNTILGLYDIINVWRSNVAIVSAVKQMHPLKAPGFVTARDALRLLPDPVTHRYCPLWVLYGVGPHGFLSPPSSGFEPGTCP